MPNDDWVPRVGEKIIVLERELWFYMDAVVVEGLHYNKPWGFCVTVENAQYPRRFVYPEDIMLIPGRYRDPYYTGDPDVEPRTGTPNDTWVQKPGETIIVKHHDSNIGYIELKVDVNGAARSKAYPNGYSFEREDVMLIPGRYRKPGYAGDPDVEPRIKASDDSWIPKPGETVTIEDPSQTRFLRVEVLGVRITSHPEVLAIDARGQLGTFTVSKERIMFIPGRYRDPRYKLDPGVEPKPKEVNQR
jgi:hypothetical protein